MRCWQCGSPVREGARICVYCGASIPEATPSSGSRQPSRHDAPPERPYGASMPPSGSAGTRRSSSEPPRRGARYDERDPRYPDERTPQERRWEDTPQWDEPDDSREQSAVWQPRDENRRNDRYHPYEDDDYAEPDTTGESDAQMNAGAGYVESEELPAAPPRRGEMGRPSRANLSERADAPMDGRRRSYRPASGSHYSRDSGEQDPDDADDARDASWRGADGRRGGEPPRDTRQRSGRARASLPLRNDAGDLIYGGAGLPPLTTSRPAVRGDVPGMGYPRATPPRAPERTGSTDAPRPSDSDGSWGAYGGGERRGGPPQRPARAEQGQRRGTYPGTYPGEGGGVRIPVEQRSARGGQGAGRGSRRARLAVAVAIVVLLAGAALLLWPRLHGKLLTSTRHAVADVAPFATYTPGPTPTVIPHFKYYQSAASGYIVSVPDTWNVQTESKTSQGQADHIESFAPTGSASPLFSVEQAAAASGYSNSQLIATEVSAAQVSGVAYGITYIEVTSAATTQTIGGEQWQRREYAVKGGGTAARVAVLACHHSGRGYVIVLYSADADFAHNDQIAFTPTLQSFRFSA